MGFADGFYYGQGRIICDTSTFSVGDTIRVRSMTDSSKVWNQQVATVGTSLVFTVPPYDYYKICEVQDIGGVATEVGEVYREIGFGTSVYIGIADWDKQSMAYAQSVLNSHQELSLLNIGDEFKIKVSMSGVPTDWPVLVGAVNLYSSHEIIYISKYVEDYMDMVNVSAYSTSKFRTALDTFYSNIDSKDKQYIKVKTVNAGKGNYGNTLDTSDNYVWLPTAYEIWGSKSGVPTIEASYNSRFPIFTTASNRIRQNTSGVTSYWWTASKDATNTTAHWLAVKPSDGDSIGINNNTIPAYLLPCFRLTADS